jgi:lipid-binding SYLF domain-containing protein
MQRFSFEAQVPGARELAIMAAGILVFHSVIKAGDWIWRRYGEGLLIIRGPPYPPLHTKKHGRLNGADSSGSLRWSVYSAAGSS